MRRYFAVFIVVSCFCVNSATADDKKRATALHRDGSALAKAGRFESAIAKYKESYQLHAVWQPLCNIAGAYHSLNRPTRAALFFDRCKKQAAAAFPTSQRKWSRKVAKKLRAGAYASVTISVTPPDAAIVVSGFASDEVISSGTEFWLPLGKHKIEVTKEGMLPHVWALDLKTKTPKRHAVTLQPKPVTVTNSTRGEPPPPAKVTPTRALPLVVKSPTDDRPPSRVGVATWALLGGGGLSLGAGALFHVLAVRTFDRAEALPARPGDVDYPEFDAEVATYDKQRLAAAGFYAVGVIAVGLAVYRLLRSSKDKTSKSAQTGVTRSGAVFARWSF